METRIRLIVENKEGRHEMVEVVDNSCFLDTAGPFDLEPPSPYSFNSTFVAAVSVIKRRIIRKQRFTEVATRLGKLLAEHMEDKEGWHGENRKERKFRHD